MTNRALLLILMVWCGVFAAIDTLKSGNMDNPASWSLGALPSGTDTALFCSAYNVACSTTTTTNISCRAFIWRSGFTQTTSMPNCTLSTFYYCDSSTGGNKPRLKRLILTGGDSAVLIMAASSGMTNAYTAATVIEVNSKNTVFNDYKGTDHAQIVINNGMSVRSCRNNLHFAYAPAGQSIIKMNGNGYLAWGSNCVMNTSGRFFDIQETDTLLHSYAFNNNGSNITCTLPSYNRYGTGTLAVGFSALADPACKVYCGSITQLVPKQPFYSLSNNAGHSGAHIYYNGNLDIGQFYYGGAGSVNIHFGQGTTLTLGLQAYSWDGITNTSRDTLWFNDNIINNYRSWRYSPHNVVNGNYTVREVGYTVDETILSNGKKFRTFKNVRATPTRYTKLADSMQCDTAFIDSAGKFSLNTYPLYTKKLVVHTADSFIVNAPIYIYNGGSVETNSNVKFIWNENGKIVLLGSAVITSNGAILPPIERRKKSTGNNKPRVSIDLGL